MVIQNSVETGQVAAEPSPSMSPAGDASDAGEVTLDGSSGTVG